MRLLLILTFAVVFLSGMIITAEAQYAGQQKYKTKLVLDPIKPTAKQNEMVSFSGQLLTTDGKYVIKQATIYIKDRVSASSDRHIMTLVTDNDGKFSGKWQAKIRPSGTWNLYAVFEGIDQISSAKSRMYSVSVVPNPNQQNSYQISSVQKVSPTQYQKTYRVYVDPLPSWASYAGNVMYDATKAWETANPGLRFYKADSQRDADILVKWVKEFGGEHVGYTFGQRLIEVGLGDSNCRGIWQPYSPKYISFIMAHELGHVLGHEHSSDPQSLMYPIALNREYGVEELEYTLTKGYARFIPLCTIKNITSYEYSVSTGDGRSGFSVYFVPSSTELTKWSNGKGFSHYSAKGCFGEGYTKYSGMCERVEKQGGLLVIMDKNAGPLTKVNVKLLEK
jgi:hypothetical protein